MNGIVRFSKRLTSPSTWTSRVFRSTTTLIALLAVMAETAVSGDNPSDPSRSLVATVISGIKANYSQLRTLELIVEETTLDSTVQTEEVQTFKTPGGNVTGSLTFAPKITLEWKFYLDGDKVRRDARESGPGKRVTETMLFRDGAWTQYAPESKIAWLRRPDQMSGIGVVDIRDIGAPSLAETVLDVLQRDEIGSAQIVKSSQGLDLIELVTRGLNGQRNWEFNPKYGCLPTSRLSRYDDGSIRQIVRVTYQSILNGIAWLPLQERTLFFNKGVTKLPAEDKWTQCRTVLVKKIVAVNQPVKEEIFALPLPDGTRVKDALKRRNYVVGRLSPRASKASLAVEGHRSLWLALSVATLLLLCVSLIVRRTRRVSQSERRL